MVDVAQSAAMRWWETVGVRVEDGLGGAVAHQAFIAGWDAREGTVGCRTRDIDSGRERGASSPIAIIAQVLRDNPARPHSEQARLIVDALLAARLLHEMGPPRGVVQKGCICPPSAEVTCQRGDCGRRGVQTASWHG